MFAQGLFTPLQLLFGVEIHIFFITGVINVMKSQIAKVKFDFDIFDSVLNTQNSILGWQWL